jgi:hypothetical protein
MPRGNPRPAEERFFEKFIPEPMSGCWLWIGSWNADDYGTINMGGKSTLAHRLSYALHRGEIPENICVLHSCDVPCCVNPEHLFLGTPLDNVTDMERKQRSCHPAGEHHGRAKLTEDDVRAIRIDLRGQRVVAKDYGVSAHTVMSIRHGRIWKGVA